MVLFPRFRSLLAATALAGFACLPARAQTAGSTFGSVVPLSGQPSDIVLDEGRGRLYAVSSGANRVYVYNYLTDSVEGSIPVGSSPLSAAMSMDGRYLYVSNVASSSLSVIDLDIDFVIQTVALPAQPEGVAVGFDGRVLITTQGTGLNNALNTLLLFDRGQEAFQQLSAVPSPPTINTPNPLPVVFAGRPATPFPGRLMRTPDGQFIIGMVAINQTQASATTTVFVYEVASGTALRSRSVTGQSTVLAVSPDGARFMAGSTLYDTATLNVLSQVSTANLPFLIGATAANPAIAIQRNFGGSVFSLDGETIHGVFNVGANQVNALTIADALLIMQSKNLSARLGIRMPEDVLGKILLSSSGEEMFATSESGIIRIPIARLFESPIVQPESTQVFLATDNCNKGIARARLRINNVGGGKATFTVPSTTTALVAELTSGVAPSEVTFVMEPGRTGVNRFPGTNVYTGGALGTGAPINVAISSREAVNFPEVVRVYMNYRQPDQRGVIHPVPTTLAAAEGLQELLLDEPRGRVYISNSGYNRIEVFDMRRQRFVEPIDVGQLPHSMAMTLDRSLLYVGDTGGESITIVDLDARRAVGRVNFPPIPRVGAQQSIRPLALGMALSGLQFIMSSAANNAGTLWRLVGNDALPRPASQVVTPNSSTTTLSQPLQFSYAQTPGGEYLVAMAGNGTVYLYDALADSFVTSRVIQTNPIQSYYGPAAGAPGGSFFMVNGLILSPALAVIGGAERPGATQTTAPTMPGQQPGQVTVSTGQRHIAAVYPIDETTFVRMTLPVRTNPTAATRDDSRPIIEMVDVRNGGELVVAIAPENPPVTAVGTARFSVPARQMAVDSNNIAYVITLSGLSVIPLQPSGRLLPRPALTTGSRGIVNANTGTVSFTPGAFVSVSGQNLAVPSVAETLPLPTVMGGSCVTLNDVPLNLLQTAPDQITAQIPDDLRPGLYVAQVRSLANATQSDPVLITVQRPQ